MKWTRPFAAVLLAASTLAVGACKSKPDVPVVTAPPADYEPPADQDSCGGDRKPNVPTKGLPNSLPCP